MKLNLSLLGAIGGIVAMMFIYSLKIMYPSGASGFIQLYITAMIIVGILSWIVWRKVNRVGIFVKMNFSILALTTVCTLAAGISYSFIQKTEEFLIYFLLVTLTGIVSWVEVIRHMVSSQKSTDILSMIAGLGLGLTLASLFSPLVLWIGVLILTMSYGYLSIGSKLAFK